MQNETVPESVQQPIPLPPTPSVESTPPQSLPSQQTPRQGVSAKQIVLQWLSYSLWCWSLATIATLLSSSLTYYFVSGAKESGSYEWQLYFVAAMICLVPAAFFVDRLFSKAEEPKKHGFSAVVMVLNAVGVFLAALGSSITFVISIFRLVLSPADTRGTQILLISSSIVALLSFALFFRILYLEKFKSFPALFRYTMLGVSVLALIMTLVGPFVRELSLKDDRLLEEGLSSLNESIREYVTEKDTLPESLTQLDLDDYNEDKARLIRDRNMVRYTKDPSSTSSESNSSSLNRTGTSSLRVTATITYLRYQLCVTYKGEKGTNYSSAYDSREEYSQYLSNYYHPKGEVCYKLQQIK